MIGFLRGGLRSQIKHMWVELDWLGMDIGTKNRLG